jgi:hypothetical protein
MFVDINKVLLYFFKNVDIIVINTMIQSKFDATPSLNFHQLPVISIFFPLIWNIKYRLKTKLIPRPLPYFRDKSNEPNYVMIRQRRATVINL